MQPHGVRRHLFSCREMSVNRREACPPPMTFGQPLQALESAVVRGLLSVAGAAGRDSKSKWRDATVGYSDGR
jgi:hypothetical protein